MAQQFKINGTNINFVVRAHWVDDQAGSYLNGKSAVNRWRQLLWLTEGMTQSEYQSLYDLEGQRVYIDTPDYDDRNNANYKTYYQVELRSVRANHIGPAFENVVLEFMVRVT